MGEYRLLGGLEADVCVEMSGRLNPVLREALRLEKKKALERERKKRKFLDNGKEARGSVSHDGGFQSKMAETAHAEILKFREARVHEDDDLAEKGHQDLSEKGHQDLATKEDGGIEMDERPCLADGTGHFDVEKDLEDLESDEEGGQDEAGPVPAELPPAGVAGPMPMPEDDREVMAYPEVSSQEDHDDDDVPETCIEEDVPFKQEVSMMKECRSVERYEKLNRISEGTYGVVYRAKEKETGRICALKRMKLEQEKSGFPLTYVREINVLLALEHPNIVNVSEVVVGSKQSDPRNDNVFLVMEYADHDLKSVMDKRMKKPFTIAEVKCLMLQLLAGVAYLHKNWVIHRDLKTANILYTNKGQLKICDFGLARLYSSFPKGYTQLVVTLWYRAPELLLGDRLYSTPIDMWSVGCIMGELLLKKPLLPGKTETEQLGLIFAMVGYPSEEDVQKFKSFPLWNTLSIKKRGSNSHGQLMSLFSSPTEDYGSLSDIGNSGIDLLYKLLALNPVCCLVWILHTINLRTNDSQKSDFDAGEANICRRSTTPPMVQGAPFAKRPIYDAYVQINKRISSQQDLIYIFSFPGNVDLC